jgi:hypothetical protein
MVPRPLRNGVCGAESGMNPPIISVPIGPSRTIKRGHATQKRSHPRNQDAIKGLGSMEFV